MEILPTSKKIWQNKNDTNFEIFLSSILSWCNKEGLFAVDYHISEFCFHNFLKKIGFQLENHDKSYLPPVFSPISILPSSGIEAIDLFIVVAGTNVPLKLTNFFDSI